jgi:hypothetical protein
MSSGIIGEVGSRSGVIGETTMQFEEGSFTPTFNVTVSGGTTKGYYIRKGNEVTIYVQWNGTWSGTLSSVRSLPLSVDASTAGYSVGKMLNNNNGASMIGRFEDTEWLYVSGTVSGSLHIANGSYITDS